MIAVARDDARIEQALRHIERKSLSRARKKILRSRWGMSDRQAGRHHMNSFKLSAGAMAKNSLCEAMPNIGVPATSRSSPSSTRS